LREALRRKAHLGKLARLWGLGRIANLGRLGSLRRRGRWRRLGARSITHNCVTIRRVGRARVSRHLARACVGRHLARACVGRHLARVSWHLARACVGRHLARVRRHLARVRRHLGSVLACALVGWGHLLVLRGWNRLLGNELFLLRVASSLSPPVPRVVFLIGKSL